MDISEVKNVITKIRLDNGEVYNIKDTKLREEIKKLMGDPEEESKDE